MRGRRRLRRRALGSGSTPGTPTGLLRLRARNRGARSENNHRASQKCRTKPQESQGPQTKNRNHELTSRIPVVLIRWIKRGYGVDRYAETCHQSWAGAVALKGCLRETAIEAT